jgi:PspAA-like protein
VRSRGEKLDDADLTPSDAIIPPEDLSLDEARELLEGEGLIPDVPTA